MQIGEFTFRTKDKGFLQPEPLPVNPLLEADVRPEEARPLPYPMYSLPGRVQTTYLQGDDKVLWTHGAANQNTGQRFPNTSRAYLAGVQYTTQQPVVVRRARDYHHFDVQARSQQANTFQGGASFFALGYGFGPTAGRGSAHPGMPGGGPAIQRPPPRNPFVVRVPRFSTAPARITATVSSGPGVNRVIGPGTLSSKLPSAAPNIVTKPQGIF